VRNLIIQACSALSLSLAIGCADPVQAPGPPLLSITSPPPAQAEPGAVLSPITIRLADATGTPHAGQRVIIEGDGGITISDSVTDASGQIEIQWTLPRATDVPFVFGAFGLEGTHTLRVSTPGGAVREAWSVRTDWFRADQIDAAFSYGCGVVGPGLWCFGAVPPNLFGGSRAVRPRQVSLPPLLLPAEVRLNEHAACIRNAVDGRPWCATGWSGPAGFRPVPDAPAFVQLVDAGRQFCGRTAEGVVACWVVRSRSDEDGGFGPVTPVDTMRFVQLAGQSLATGIAPMFTLACALDTRGEVWCWGTNVGGRLGSPGLDSTATPVRVPIPGAMTSVRVGTEGGCASTALGETWCWGDYFGPGDFTPRMVTREGPPSSVIIPAHFELFELWPGELRADFYGERWEPFPGLLQYAPINHIVNEGQACAHAATRAVFCSWILLRGGGDTSILTAALIPVPAP
jgi:hypothetical protein